MKTCANCNGTFTLEEFANNPKSKDGKSDKCRVCFNERIRNKYTTEDRRRHHLRYKYRLTIEEYEQLYSSRNGVCDICKNKFDILHIDHDHSCCPGKTSCGKCIRGLLCGPCNRALGLVKDDVDTVKRMIYYLEDYS